MQSFAGAGRQEHAVEINLFLLIKAMSPRDRQERLLPSVQLQTATQPFSEGEEVNARSKRHGALQLLSYLGAADRKS